MWDVDADAEGDSGGANVIAGEGVADDDAVPSSSVSCSGSAEGEAEMDGSG